MKELYDKNWGACFECCDFESMMEQIESYMSEYATAYANERFEKAVVEEKDTLVPSGADEWDGNIIQDIATATGYNACRSEIIARWNNLK